MKIIRFASILMASAIVPAFAIAASPTCPAYGSATLGCNTDIVVGAGGALTVTAGPSATPYDGSDDNLVGILNNSGHTVNSIVLSGSGADGGLFSFDGDGIDGYGAPGNSTDKTGYGGPLSYFTNISPDASTGTVNFLGGLANGAETYFSLENSFSEAPITPGPPSTTVTPEPGTFLLLGTGALGFAGSIKRRFSAR